MVNWRQVRVSRKLVIALCFLALVLLAGLLVFNKFKSTGEVKLSYIDRRLTTLSDAIDVLPSVLSQTGNVTTDLENYKNTLDVIQKSCEEIIAFGEKQYTKTSLIDSRDVIDGSGKLCIDLNNVVSYSNALYSSLKQYLTLDTANWPEIGEPNFSNYLLQTKKVTSHTIYLLEKLGKTGINDPAIGELITQLKLTERLAKDSQTFFNSGEDKKTNQVYEQLHHEINKDKQDFLYARDYFWRNTVQIDALAGKLADLKAELEHKP